MHNWNVSFDQSKIDFFDAMDAKLFRKSAGSFAGPGEYDHTGNRSIQSMNHTHKNVTWLLILFSQVFSNRIDKRRFASVITHGQQPRRLFDCQTVVVLIQNNRMPDHKICFPVGSIRKKQPGIAG